MIRKACKICGQGTRIVHDAQFGVDYYHCKKCGFMFMDEAKTLPAELERKRYLAHINSPEDKGYVDMFKRFIEESIVPFQGKTKRKKTTALDFGCGPGPVLAGLLKQNGYETDIYDIYFAPEPVYRRKTYDLITCTEVLEHLRDPLKELTELKNHLKPGGIMAAMTLFHPVDGTPDGEEAFNRWWYRRDRTHISFYRPETFRSLANKLNLKILTTNEKNIVTLARRRDAKGPTGLNRSFYGAFFKKRLPEGPPEA